MSDDITLITEMDLCNYVWSNHEQFMMDNGVTFKRPASSPNVEFYIYGPTHIAICVYEIKTGSGYALLGERLELLTLKKNSSTSMVDIAIKELVNMIKRKRIGPVTRRIKFLDN